MKKKYNEAESVSFMEPLGEFILRIYCWIIFNPLVYPVLLLIFRKKIIAHACKIFEKRISVLWPFVVWLSCNFGSSISYWFHFYTKLKYAPIHTQVWMICETEEEMLKQIYSDKYVNQQVKRFCLWMNPKFSENFRIYMMKNGFRPEQAEFKFVLERNQSSVVREMVRQTISDEQCVLFWEKAIESDGRNILSIFVDYVIREGLTQRMTTYVMQTYDCIAKKAALKALETHRAVAFVKRSKANDVFRHILLKGVDFPYEAQCCLTVALYKIYKECRYELGEKAIIYHLQQEGEMAKEILTEQREFTSDVMTIITSSPKLSSWYRHRV